LTATSRAGRVEQIENWIRWYLRFLSNTLCARLMMTE
jgi:hypothetical protein